MSKNIIPTQVGLSSLSSDDTSDKKPLSITETMSSYIESYENFVSESSWYPSFVEGLKSMTLFLPGRFSPDGVGAQSIFTTLSLITHYHDVITGTAQASQISSNVDIAGYKQNIATSLPSFVRKLNSLMFVISSTECLVEMGSVAMFNFFNKSSFDDIIKRTPGQYFRTIEENKYNSRVSSFKWKIIFILEFTKFIIRMCLLIANNGKILTPPPAQDSILHRLQRLAKNDVRKFRQAVNTLRERRKARREQEKMDAEAKLKAETGAEAEAETEAKTKALLEQNTKTIDLQDNSTEVTESSSNENVNDTVNPNALTHIKDAKETNETKDTKNTKNKNKNAKSTQTITSTLRHGGDVVPPSLRSLQEMYIRHGRHQVPHGVFVQKVDFNLHPRERRDYVPALSHVASEVLYWIRPSIYVAGKLQFGDMAWAPLLLSAITDFLARKLAGPLDEMSPAQQEQWSSRVKMYFYYMFRSPFFDYVTTKPLRWMMRLCAHIPIVSTITAVIYEIFTALQQLYFYTAAS